MIWKWPARGVLRQAPALFLDRAGVLIVDRDYLADPGGVEMVPGVPKALVQAAAAGYALIGLSNQSGLGRGRFGPAQLAAVMSRVDAELAGHGAELDAMYYCPHAPADQCRCRKPGPGLLEEAAASFEWPADRSWVIGDGGTPIGGRGGPRASMRIRCTAGRSSTKWRWPRGMRAVPRKPTAHPGRPGLRLSPKRQTGLPPN